MQTASFSFSQPEMRARMVAAIAGMTPSPTKWQNRHLVCGWETLRNAGHDQENLFSILNPEQIIDFTEPLAARAALRALR